MFANDEIKSENGEPLEVAICDATNLDTINSSPLSSASIEFFILDGEFDYEKRRTSWTSSDFNQRILTSRKNKPPLILGNDQLYLQDGVCFVKKLIVTDNSSWTKSKMFCLGVKIKDKKLSLEFGMIGEAVSQPFRVLTDRMRGKLVFFCFFHLYVYTCIYIHTNLSIIYNNFLFYIILIRYAKA